MQVRVYGVEEKNVKPQEGSISFKRLIVALLLGLISFVVSAIILKTVMKKKAVKWKEWNYVLYTQLPMLLIGAFVSSINGLGLVLMIFIIIITMLIGYGLASVIFDE